ncbi:MAG: aldose 1-epimerase family protein [Proteobacteria bacterium]|nr:aldose 1-epimerase family protein [Pseudomonadota bacterium]
MQDWISLRSPELSAAINPMGAQLSILRDSNGRDLLWNGDTSVWAGRAPLLFPIIGELAGGAFRVGSKEYKLPRHGFARNSAFQVVSASATAATFRLSAGGATLAVYPFAFQLDVSFVLAGATLNIKSSVRNPGSGPLTASVGYHPGFRWPLPYGQAREAHFIEFEHEEGAFIRRLDAHGLLAPQGQPTPVVNRRLVLNDALFRDDVVIFDNLRSHSVTYGAAAGPRLRVDYPDATYLGIWTKPAHAPFICIEPWHGIADIAGFTGDFQDKLGVFTIAPGEVQELNMNITLLA